MTSNEIRQQFLDFFTRKHGHVFVPSSSVVPHDDPTLLFTNAGMNQFKPIFLGQEKREYVRATNSQKCIRAGGKHNDLDDVGKDTYHHTFFEMLGNWSFGDYFKREAIEWAWDLLTNVWKLDKTRLHATVFMGDPAEGLEADRETADLWKSVTDINPDHVHLGNKKDNFWEMGDTGPCGPCSEIHIDLTPDKSGARLVNAGDPRVMEIWNLVFIQFNRGLDGRLTPLPARHVDTGMGFERLCAVVQGKNSNYDTDVFRPLLDGIADLAKARYGGALDNPVDIAFRVIADHARMSTFAITDGAVPSNKKRGAVLRSVIRRAVRFGYQTMKFSDPFLYKLVPVIVDQLGHAFPELRTDPERVAQTIKDEEASFYATVDRGIGMFNEAALFAQSLHEPISAKAIFDLHTTYGFPPDLTLQMAAERCLKVDMDGYQMLFDQFRQDSGKDRREAVMGILDFRNIKPTDDSAKYASMTMTGAKIAAVTDAHASMPIVTTAGGDLSPGQAGIVILDRTCFYAEQGGQVGDKGLIRTTRGTFRVANTRRQGDYILHEGIVEDGFIQVGEQADLEVDARRSDTMRNHTATHILNWALRKVLGDHVEQKGSLVDPEKLRFDFSHGQAMTAEEIKQVERMVNERIYADLPVSANVMALAEAKKIAGVRAVFGEKYPDPVRVVAIGTDDPSRHSAVEHSIEFCGGTHLRRTGEAGFFKITAEESVSKGVRRLTAVTGRGAVECIQQMEANLRSVSQALSASPEEAPKRIGILQEEIKSLKKKLASGGGAKGDPLAVAATLLEAAPALGPGKLIVGEIPGATDEQLRSAMDSLKKKAPSHGILLASVEDGKVTFVAAVSDDLIAQGLKAGDWVREAAKVAGGGGGGRPQMAQAGGKDPAKLGEALETGRRFAEQVVK
jgi:alanyl-tRNA synthetase